LTGGALAVCRASYRGSFKKPMADPFILKNIKAHKKIYEIGDYDEFFEFLKQ
jgi:ABC-type Fe3+-siderophore transport system permease subunit